VIPKRLVSLCPVEVNAPLTWALPKASWSTG